MLSGTQGRTVGVIQIWIMTSGCWEQDSVQRFKLESSQTNVVLTSQWDFYVLDTKVTD